MRGAIFVELIKMAEDAFGEDTVDLVLNKADLQNDGAYTTVGNYSCSELVRIVEAFSLHSGIDADVLQHKFGHWMLGYFAAHYADSFDSKDSAFAMLEAIDGEIHVEVRKLYPDAELPHFETKLVQSDQLHMTYSSPRPLVDFCHGMIEACFAKYNETADISRCPAHSDPAATTFQITRTS